MMNDGYKKQLKEVKHAVEQAISVLCDMKLRLVGVNAQLAKQQEIMKLFYEEYQALKRRQGNEHLMNYIQLRDEMLKEMKMYRERSLSDEYEILRIYVNELTEILEEQGVEIICAKPGTDFNPEIQKPIKRVLAKHPKFHDKIYRVYSCGYRLDGRILKKMDVSVAVYDAR